MKTFLVVDDSSTVRKVARRMLEQLSFTVTEAEDGQKALEQCATGLPDAILLDWNMPVTNGRTSCGSCVNATGVEIPK